MSYEWHVDPEEMIQNLKKRMKVKDTRIATLEAQISNIDTSDLMNQSERIAKLEKIN